ncbi:hypothetical protein IPM65_02680 [Candidatus Roizmanbacteria bacterium]|nr:MAG: hypothetical protein IPM65_02680 [Candidatus Roizmanbacteria bacterium]
MKQFVIIVLAFLSALFFVPSIYNITQSQSINIEEKEVLYQLPYPGLLPDHPLYLVKVMRDNILLFTTRDNYKKANLYLHLSDKHMSAAMELANKGTEQLAIKELMKAEDKFLHIPELLKEVKEQGGSYPSDFMPELYQSNAKHKQVITDVMEKTTQAEIDTLQSLLKKNEEAKSSLDKLR